MNMNTSAKKTICTVLTPKGRGAVAVVALAGPQSESVIEEHFQPANRKPYRSTAPRKVVYGIWNPTNEDLVVFRREDSNFEIHCHGGITASSAIIANLCDSKIDFVEPSEFVKATSEAGNWVEQVTAKWKSEVVLALTNATTNRTAEILLAQVESLPSEICEIVSKIDSGDLGGALESIEALKKCSRFGVHLTQPRSIVLCGRPNVGKSSLINAIAGFQRAIVHDQPGTTRDVVTQLTAVDGWPVELKDTAGLRESEGAIETIGIEKARAQIESADIKVAVFDSSRIWSEDDSGLIATIEPQIVVHNKVDLVESRDASSDGHGMRAEGILTSTESGEGVELLIQRLAELIAIELPNEGHAIPVSQIQVERLKEAADLIRGSQGGKQEDSARELILKTLGVLAR